MGDHFINIDRCYIFCEETIRVYSFYPFNRLLDSKQLQGIPHTAAVKNNLKEAIDEYLSRYDNYDNSLCPKCEKEALVVRGSRPSQDGCFCYDHTVTRDTSVCPIVGKLAFENFHNSEEN